MTEHTQTDDKDLPLHSVLLMRLCADLLQKGTSPALLLQTLISCCVTVCRIMVGIDQSVIEIMKSEGNGRRGKAMKSIFNGLLELKSVVDEKTGDISEVITEIYGKVPSDVN